MNHVMTHARTLIPLGALILGGAPAAPAAGQCELARLIDRDGGADRLGADVDVSQDRAITGAPLNDAFGINAGAAFVYRFEEGAWVLEAMLGAPDAAPSDQFGGAVAIDGEWAAVGAAGDDDGGSDSGSVHVFRRTGVAWRHFTRLTASDAQALDAFGVDVAIDGDVIAVGADGDDDNGTGAGAAYVFRFDGTSWSQEQKLLAFDGAANDGYGVAISVAGEVIAVGSPMDDDNGSSSGSAYVHRWNGSAWVNDGKSAPPETNAGDRFGRSVAIRGNVLLVGAFLDDEAGSNAGAAYVMQREGAAWTMVQKITAPDGSSGDRFGRSVALGESVAAVGAFEYDGVASNTGAVYVIDTSTEPWHINSLLVASDASGGEELGLEIAIDGDLLVAGAAMSDGGAGAAYVFAGILDVDCNDNGVADGCDIALGTSLDIDGDGVPDECALPGDINGDGVVDLTDLLIILQNWGACPPDPPCPGDIDGDGIVGIMDLLMLLVDWS